MNSHNSFAKIPLSMSMMSQYNDSAQNPANSLGYKGEPEADSKYKGDGDFQLESDDYKSDEDWL